MMTDHNLQELVVAELDKLGWQPTPDVAHVVIARLPIQTFRGEDFVKILPLTHFEDGPSLVRAEFISTGENVLASCSAYISDPDEVKATIALFHLDILHYVSKAYSVRVSSRTFDIYIDGQLKYPDLTAAQANIYWAGLNIFGAHTATLKEGKKVIARKGERDG